MLTRGGGNAGLAHDRAEGAADAAGAPGKQTLASAFYGASRPANRSAAQTGSSFGRGTTPDDAAFWFAFSATPDADPAAPEAPGAAPAPGGGAPAPLLVEDGGKVGPNQMSKTDFLGEMRQVMPGEDTAQWETRPVAELEKDIRKRVPGAANARSARDYLSAISAQVQAQAQNPGEAPHVSEPAHASAGQSEHAATELMRSGGMGPGRPLDGGARAAMEGVFQHDFSNVRIHTGEQASTLAGQLGARAFTVGHQIAFAAGNYAPGTPVGDALIAHELAHVVQQKGATSSERGDSHALDADADHAAAFAVSALHGGPMSAGAPATPSLRSGIGLQRCNGSGGGTSGGGALTFSSASHTPGGGGAATATPGAAQLLVQSSAFSSAASVKATGGTDADAAGWDVGYLQTVRSAARVGHYLGSPAATRFTVALPANTRDGNPAGVAPWYDSANPSAKKAFTKTGTTESVSLWDQPGNPFPWDTPDGKGKLDKTDGKDKFTAWIVVRQRASPNTIQFINWETWEVDFSTTTNYASKGAKTVAAVTGATTATGSGAGQGASAPNLTGAVANNVATATWS